jgi:hypothetical protein
MAATIDDTTANPVVTPSGTTAMPFGRVVLNETALPALEVVSVSLSAGPNTGGDLGSLSDPMGFGQFNSSTGIFVESAFSIGSPSAATNILRRLVYTPPTLANGAYATVDAAINIGSTALPPVPGSTTLAADPHNPVVLTAVTPPGVSGTVGGQQVASGTVLRPFASALITDNTPGYDAQTTGKLTLTDATGAASDAGGVLAGPGLTKTGVGAYALAAGSSYALQSSLQSLAFTAAAVAGGSTQTTGFDLSVSDAATKLTVDDKSVTVQVAGPSAEPVAPFIVGTSGQTVAAGNGINPFNGVTVSDSNAKPLVSATLTMSGGGTLSGAGLAAAGGGVYTLAAASPAALTASLQKLAFTASPLAGQDSATSTIKLDIANGAQVASDSQTAVTTMASLPRSSGGANFTITDQTTGQQIFISGDSYSGPVQGLSQQLNLVTPNNLNITATMPNVFIRTGSGDDAIDVSKVNGNNVLDGASGSSFLTGGTGADTFFLDGRSLASDAYSTVVNFHAGDNITVFGVDATNSHLTTQDNQGAAGAKGLAYTFTSAGKPNATVVIAGFSSADLANGRLTASYGANPATPGVAGSGGSYFNIHGN